MKFTKQSIAALAIPDGKTEHLAWDDDCPGFGVRLRATGSLTWFIQYRINGRQRRESFGDIRKVSLEDARKIARQRFAKIELGIDPATERTQAVQAQALTLKVVASRYLDARQSRIRQSSFKLVTRYLDQHWKPLHNRALDAIKKPDVAARLQEITKASGPIAARSAQTTLSALYVWAIKEGLCEINPVIGTNNPAEGTSSRDRIFSDSELRVIWNACRDDNFSRIVKLLLLTGCRRTEIGQLKWSEVDLDAGVMTIPGSRTKNHRTLTLILSKPAIELLRTQPRNHQDYVFVGARGGIIAGAWSAWTREFKARIIKAEGKPLAPWVLHDFRRTMRTNLGKLGVPPHIAERCVNHIKGGVEAVYDRYRYQPEMGQALALWAEHLLAIVEGRDSKVVPMPKRA
jgi:integrase